MKKVISGIGVVLLLGVVAAFLFSSSCPDCGTAGHRHAADSETPPETVAQETPLLEEQPAESIIDENGKRIIVAVPYEDEDEARQLAAEAEALRKTEEETIRAVKAWEDLTDDVIREDSEEPISTRAKRVKEALKKVPESERDVALQSMLNLVPDETFAILDDILFDLTEPKEVVEAIFDDMLNRPDSLKLGYLVRIAQIREHPMFTDAMHILTVTAADPDDAETTAE